MSFVTPAARISVIGCRDSVLDVVIKECLNIKCGACPPNGVKYSIPYCSSCSGQLDPCPIGEEFVVAGKNSADSLYIANYKKGGIYANFDSNQDWKNGVPECR